MKRVNIYEAKARLAALIDAVEGGERVVICRRNRPVAELTRVSAVRTAPRPVGGGRGTFTLPQSFYEPLPDAFLDDFTVAGTRVIASDRAPLVAERPAAARGAHRRRARKAR